MYICSFIYDAINTNARVCIHCRIDVCFQEQYQFLYELALEYMAQFDQYANFQ